jgi:hypothetical protein
MVMRNFAAAILAVLFVACSGDGGGSDSGGAATYAVGGTVNNLPAGATLTLQDNGADDLAITVNGAFKFPTRLASGAAYKATIKAQPANANCSFGLGTDAGTVGNADVTGIVVNCQANVGPPTFAVGGTVNNLPAGASLTLQDNNADDLTLNQNGAFKFSTKLLSGDAYKATIKTQPSTANCSFGAGTDSGIVANADVASIVVNCVAVAVSSATTGTTALAVLATANARVAIVPSGGNLIPVVLEETGFAPAAWSAGAGRPVAAAARAAAVGTGALTPLALPIAVDACGVDSANLITLCVAYQSTQVVLVDLSKFAVTLNPADMVATAYETGAPNTSTGFSGTNCIICGGVTVPNRNGFVVTAHDGYRFYAYPAAGGPTTLAPAHIYAVPISENFAVDPQGSRIISPSYAASTAVNGTQVTLSHTLTLIDLVKQAVYSMPVITGTCVPTDPTCLVTAGAAIDSAAYAVTSQMVTLMTEQGNAMYQVDLSQAVYDSPQAGSFTAPVREVALASAPSVEMSGVLASPTTDFVFNVAEFATWVGVFMAPYAGSGGQVPPVPPYPLYVDLSTLDWQATCTGLSPGADPHAQGYLLSMNGSAKGVFLSAGRECMALVDLGYMFNFSTRDPANLSRLAAGYNPLADGAIHFVKIQ